MFDKIKEIVRDDTIFYGLLILFIGVSSFGLGRWSLDGNVAEQPASIVFSETNPNTTINDSETRDGTESPSQIASNNSGQYVASKNGSKYHLPWCSGAKQMKEENKIWFQSKAEAEAAGYTSAGNCKGL